MITLEIPQDEETNQLLAKWVLQRVPLPGLTHFQCLAFFDPERGVQAVVMYHNYRKTDIEIVFACEPGGRWAHRDLMKMAINYPFDQLGCSRITALCRKDNKKVRKLMYQVGFKQEGKIRRADDDGADLFIYGLLPEEYRLGRKNTMRKAA